MLQTETMVSPRAPVRVVPEDQKDRPESERIAYMVKPAGVYERPKFRRALTEHGAVFHSDAELLASLRAGVVALLSDAADAAQRDKHLALIDEARAAFDTRAESVEDAADLAARIEDLTVIVSSGYEPLAARLAAKKYWLELAPIEAFRQFVTGWQNLPFTCERDAGGVRGDLLDAVPPAHMEEVGYRALGLMTPAENERKNSPSPSPSSFAPGTSETANT